MPAFVGRLYHKNMKTEYTYEIIEVDELDESEVDEIAELLARIILEQMKKEEKDETR